MTKWIFDSENAHPVVRFEDISPDVVKYVSFPAVADIYFMARVLRERLPDEQRPGYDERTEAILHRWFSEGLVVRFATEKTSKRWMELSSLPPLHDNANREHNWVIVLAQELRDSRCELQIASEDRRTYQCFKDAGYLDDIEVL